MEKQHWESNLDQQGLKVVLIDKDHHPIASGSHDWENRLENNIWTYTLEDI